MKSKYKPYSSYRDSGIEWLGEIPEHWTRSKFGFLKTVLTDYTANGSFADLAKYVTYRDEEDYARLVRLTDLRKNLKNKQGVWVDIDSYKFLSKSALYGGEFLMANVGAYAGLFYQMPYTDKPASLAPNMFMAKFDVKKVSEHYMSYIGISDSAHQQLRLKATSSSAQPKLNKDDFKSIMFVYPPLQEQQTIANYLDTATAKIDSLIEKQTKLIALLKEKRQALISHAVTKGLNPDVKMKDSGVEWLGEIPEHWEVKKLKYSARIQGGKDQKSVLDDNGKYPVYGSGGIFGYANKYLFDGESVLLGRKGTVDKPLYVNEKFWTVDTMYYTIIEKETVAKWLYYSATTINFNYYQYGSAVPSMTQEDLHNIHFATPDKNEQQIIVDYLDSKTTQIDAFVSKVTKAIDLLQEKRTALISLAVTGKIDVREEMS